MTEIGDIEDDNVVPISDAANGTQTKVKPAPRKKFRKVKVLPSSDGQFYYVALGRNSEKIYTSETFGKRSDAIRAARREHEGRNEYFDYLLEYTNAKGNVVKETL